MHFAPESCSLNVKDVFYFGRRHDILICLFTCQIREHQSIFKKKKTFAIFWQCFKVKGYVLRRIPIRQFNLLRLVYQFKNLAPAFLLTVQAHAFAFLRTVQRQIIWNCLNDFKDRFSKQKFHSNHNSHRHNRAKNILLLRNYFIQIILNLSQMIHSFTLLTMTLISS